MTNDVSVGEGREVGGASYFGKERKSESAPQKT